MPPGGGGDLLQLEAAEARQRLELLGEVLLVLERVVEVDVVVVAQQRPHLRRGRTTVRPCGGGWNHHEAASSAAARAPAPSAS